MRVLNEYEGSHHYWEIYDKTSWYCPNCGQKDCVWEADSGDYYSGCMSICTACMTEGYLHGGMEPITEPNVKLQAEQLKSGETLNPTTERGH